MRPRRISVDSLPVGTITLAAMVGLLVTVAAPVGGWTAVQDDGGAAAFCARWEDARGALLDEMADDVVAMQMDQAETKRQLVIAMVDQIALLDDIDPAVPPAIRDDWDTAVFFRRAITDVLFTVDLAPARIRPIHLELAFESTDPETAESAALAAIDAIDRWTITACGDFCTRWPEVEQATRVDLDPGIAPEAFVEQHERDERLLDLVTPLVPADVRPAWDEARELRTLKTDALAAIPDRPWDYLDRYFEANGIDFNAQQYVDELDRRLEPVVAWVDANCESVGSGFGAPGTLRVDVDLTFDLVGMDLLIALVPPGGPVTGLTSTESLVGVECLGVDRAPDRRTAHLRSPTPRFLCHPEPTTFAPGAYDVVVLALLGMGRGDISGYLPAPDYCVRFPVVVDGNTQVSAPPLGACSLPAVAGAGADVTDGYAPAVDPTAPGAGTLTIVVPNADSPLQAPSSEPREFHAGGLALAVVVPAETTLEEIGRRDTWPSGVACLRLVTPEYTDQLEPFDRAAEQGPFPLPVTALPPTGYPSVCLAPFGLAELLRAGGGPAPAVLAAGSYDVLLEANVEVDLLGDDAHRRCYATTVTIAGDTTVEVPPATQWGACP